MGNRGLPLIKQFETLRLKPYRIDKYGKLTIGYGHELLDNESYPNGITKEKAEELLTEDIRFAEEAIDIYISVPLSLNQFGALTSFTFNVGENALRRSTLRRKLNAFDYAGAAKEFDRWIYDHGVKSNGLIKRRKAEKELFLSENELDREDNSEEGNQETIESTLEG
jgi:lysozyme